MGKRVKITKTVVDNLPIASIVWDSECTGFHARRQKSDARVYAVFYRSHGRQRFMKIGRHGGPWAPDEARKRAREILVDVANGKDPAGDRYEDRKAATVSELCDLYLVEASAGRILKRGRAKKASTLLTDKSRIEHVKRVLGHLKVESVTDRDVERLRDAVSAGTATRTLGISAPSLRSASSARCAPTIRFVVSIVLPAASEPAECSRRNTAGLARLCARWRQLCGRRRSRLRISSA
jgi:Arm DNA-binding domain